MTTISHNEHRELGNVKWHRDYDVALQVAQAARKPILLLFQEVPGCAGCVNFGHDVLEQPLLVELIEESFIPLAIFNNHLGPDADILHRFNETAWNYPVVYFLDEQGREIVPKLANRYDPIGLYEKLIFVLEAGNQDIPPYARLLRADLMVQYGLAKSITFETPCFWSGETSLAAHPAVLTTQAGWIGNEETVKVNFDPTLSTALELEEFAQQEGFRPTRKPGFKIDKATQYYVSKSRFAYLPLSHAQRTRINLAIPYKDSPEQFLSKRQRALLERPDLSSVLDKNTYLTEFTKGWN